MSVLELVPESPQAKIATAGRIGVYGGAFDPVHHGHLRSALEVKQQLQLDELRLLPSGNPPHRDLAKVSGKHRLAMLELAVADVPGMVIDPRELERDQPSYTIDTLESLQAKAPKAELTLIIGMDQFSVFDTWHRWQELLQKINLAVMERPSEVISSSAEHILAGKFAERVSVIKVTQLDISSSRIRDELALQHEVQFLVPLAVRDYIVKHGLYGGPAS